MHTQRTLASLFSLRTSFPAVVLALMLAGPSLFAQTGKSGAPHTLSAGGHTNLNQLLLVDPTTGSTMTISFTSTTNGTFSFPDPATNTGSFVTTNSSAGQTIAGGLTVNGGLALGTALTVANGGTGAISLTAKGVVVADGTNPLSTVNDGSAVAGYLLTYHAAGVSWDPAPISLPAQATHGNQFLQTDGSTASWVAIPLSNTSSVTGQLGVGNGGTGALSFTSKEVLIGNGTAAVSTVDASSAAAGYLLTYHAAGPTWDPAPVTLPTQATHTDEFLTTNGTSASWSAINLGTAASVTGVLPVARGGTSFGTYTTGDILYASSGAALSKLPVGGANSVLTVTGGVPTWQPAAAGTGVVYDANATQTSADVGATNYLFDVAYSTTVAEENALGARIAATNTATTTNHNATGLTVAATTTATGTATGITTSATGGSTQTALRITAGSVKIDPFGTAGVVLNSASGVLSSSAGPLAEANGGTGLSTYALGDLLYSDATNSLAALPGNTTTTKKFLNQTGDGSASAAPVWSALGNTDMPIVDLAHGGTNANLTAVDGGVFYSTATVGGITAAGTAGMTLHSAGTGSPTWAKVDLSSSTEVKNTLPVTNGGTGIPLYTIGDLIFASGTTQLDPLAVGGANTVLKGGGPLPVYAALVSGDIPNNAANTSGTASNVTGIVAVTHGGTNANSFNPGDLLMADPAGTTIVGVTGSSSGQVLTWGGAFWAAASPSASFTNSASNSAALTASNTFVNATTETAIGATISSTGAGAGSNSALRLTANNGTEGNHAIEITLGDIKVTPFSTAGVVLNSATGILSSTAGALPVANGGTGRATLTSGSVILGNGTGNVTMLAGTTDGHVLTWDAGTTTWKSAAPFSGVTGMGTQNALTKWNNAGGTTIGDAAVTDNGTTFAIGASKFTVTEATGATTAAGAVTITPTSNQLVLGTTRTATITAPTPATLSRTYTIPDPSNDASFIMSTMGSAQTIAGGLTVTGTTLINNSGAATTTIGAANDGNTTSITSQVNATSGWTMTGPGVLTAKGAGSAIGATSSATQLTVNGATGAISTDAVNGSAFDLAVVGDVSASGILKTTGAHFTAAAGSAFGATSSATQLTVNGATGATSSSTVNGSAFDLAVVGDVSASGVIASTGVMAAGASASQVVLGTSSTNQVQLQGTSTGVTTFAAGAQGSTSINYVMPTSIPARGASLVVSGVSGSAITLGWGYTFTSGGSITVPSGVSSITVYARAASGGGGGGGNQNATGSGAGGGGGGEGAFFSGTISVTAGEVLTLVVGAGGNGGAITTNGTSGTLTSMTGSVSGSLFSLNPGLPGTKGANGIAAGAAAGGAFGAGGASSAVTGGSPATSTAGANGVVGANGVAGAGSAGGAGGAGGNTAANGGPGGNGGVGATAGSAGTNTAGKAGSDGTVVITFQ